MKVLFKGLSGHPKAVTLGAGTLRENREYSVLEVFSRADGENLLRIESIRDELPGLFNSRLFVVTDGRIPSNWSVSIGVEGGVTFGPTAWEQAGFWDALTDGEPWAAALYAEEREKSLA
ncbi:hypothetical protein [Streptomyces barringtoniae]|uniref:hypothetical protein n=1 Tax=Streptomyces barringtoniae TaxID=2892029 RepID=UPI001E5FCE69|nr:hypothetical protein [Streptomyces barringtoniae]MCC5480510.1 hypothetical protein [Streptomyces barringtoniae]